MTLPTTTIRPDQVINAVAARYGLAGLELTVSMRTNDRIERADARHLAMWLIRRHHGYSLPRIGRLFGGRHHTTVLHALRKVEKARRKPEIAREIEALEMELFGGSK
jgi:chromosomal replication initiator protein